MADEKLTNFLVMLSVDDDLRHRFDNEADRGAVLDEFKLSKAAKDAILAHNSTKVREALKISMQSATVSLSRKKAPKARKAKAGKKR